MFAFICRFIVIGFFVFLFCFSVANNPVFSYFEKKKKLLDIQLENEELKNNQLKTDNENKAD